MITDTQILSYYFKGAMSLPEEQIRISSITAAEFLLIQSADHNKANYYPIHPSRLRHPGGTMGLGVQGTSLRVLFDSRRHAARGKHRTDQLVLDFGPNVPVYVEFGSIAITQLINEQRDQLYLASIAHLDKADQKKLAARFRFLLERRISCEPVTTSVADVGLNLLASFMDRYKPKDNPRNTINDILVLATAIKNGTRILTNDKLLSRFAAEVMNAPVAVNGPCLQIDFSLPATAIRRKSLESKGYVNRGWQVLVHRARGG